MRRRTILSLGLFGAAGLLAGCGGGTGVAGPGGSGGAAGSGVLEVARSAGHSSFLQMIARAGLADELAGSGPYTLFVPTNAAFQALPAARRGAILGDAAEARRTAAYHVVPGMVTTSFMTGFEMNHMTSTGAALNVDGRGPGIRVAGAALTRPDLVARNGVVHVIDRVLSPA
ncbi:fasciclin domain-containing protein [soil metagenome]